jgi:hypothetical protein
MCRKQMLILCWFKIRYPFNILLKVTNMIITSLHDKVTNMIITSLHDKVTNMIITSLHDKHDYYFSSRHMF